MFSRTDLVSKSRLEGREVLDLRFPLQAADHEVLPSNSLLLIVTWPAAPQPLTIICRPIRETEKKLAGMFSTSIRGKIGDIHLQ